MHWAADTRAHRSKAAYSEIGDVPWLRKGKETVLESSSNKDTGLQPPPAAIADPQRAPTLEPPARTRCRVLQTNMPPFSTSFLQCRKAKPRKRCLISPSRPCDSGRGEPQGGGRTSPNNRTQKAVRKNPTFPTCQNQKPTQKSTNGSRALMADEDQTRDPQGDQKVSPQSPPTPCFLPSGGHL